MKAFMLDPVNIIKIMFSNLDVHLQKKIYLSTIYMPVKCGVCMQWDTILLVKKSEILECVGKCADLGKII